MPSHWGRRSNCPEKSCHGESRSIHWIVRLIEILSGLGHSLLHQATGQVIYDELYPKHSKPIIDETDRVLAQHYGFTDEEVSSSTTISNTTWVSARGVLNIAAVASGSRDMPIDQVWYSVLAFPHTDGNGCPELSELYDIDSS